MSKATETESYDFVREAKEQQRLRDALEAKEKDLTAARSRNYDLTKEVEALKEQVL
jgi:polyhydroxyalkanoate synthesis regulator phasin